MTVSPTDHDLSVARTIKLSHDKLDQANADDALALALLARAAYFAPGEALPRSLLLKTVELPDTAAERRATRALARLVDLGLIDAESEDTLRLHRLIAAFVLATAGDKEAQAAVEQVMIRTASELNNAGYPAALVELETHFRHVTDCAAPRFDELSATLCGNLGSHLEAIANYAEARPYFKRALAIYEQVLGPQHPATAQSLNNLGALLRAQGDLAGARPYYERALAIREQVLGPSHPDTAGSLNNLGALLRAQGDLAGARPYYEWALAIREQVLGPAHPDTAGSLNNLGALLRAQGDLAGARPYYERALAIWEQVLGPSHPNTAQSLNNLGALLQAQGDLAGARPYYERALAIWEQVLGPSHPDTAQSLNNLGYLLRAQGDLAGARPYYERALAIWEQVLGPSHPNTATSLNNLGLLLRAQGDLAGARPYFERALAIFERALGSNHSNTQGVRDNLAALDAPPATREQQIAQIDAEAAQAVETAQASGSAVQRSELAAQLEARAQWAEAGEAEDSPYLALAARLRALAAALGNDATADERR